MYILSVGANLMLAGNNYVMAKMLEFKANTLREIYGFVNNINVTDPSPSN